MAGKDEFSNAILGGASDYIIDIGAKVFQWYQATDEDKVLCVIVLTVFYNHLPGHFTL